MQIEKEYKLPMPVEAVFNAWISSNTVIPPATQMDIKPVVGGHYRLFIDTPDGVIKNQGKFSRVEKNKRVTYTWQWNNDDEITEIDVQFFSTAEGTKMLLTHSGFTQQTSRDNHDKGWDSYIQGLTQFLQA